MGDRDQCPGPLGSALAEERSDAPCSVTTVRTCARGRGPRRRPDSGLATALSTSSEIFTSQTAVKASYPQPRMHGHVQVSPHRGRRSRPGHPGERTLAQGASPGPATRHRLDGTLPLTVGSAFSSLGEFTVADGVAEALGAARNQFQLPEALRCCLMMIWITRLGGFRFRASNSALPNARDSWSDASVW